MTPTTTYTDTTERHVSKEALREALTSELARREASKSLLGYNVYTQPGYIPSHFHKYLCDTIEEFMNRPQPNGFDILLLSTPPQHGKEEALSNDILTTTGWKKFGDVHPGDYVYSPAGIPVRVLAEIPQEQPATYVVYTSAGGAIKVHPNHEWVVVDRHLHKTVTLETKEMLSLGLSTGSITSGRGHKYRFALPKVTPLDSPEIPLAVDPYVMGAWLGDGTTSNPYICAAPEDTAVLERCRKIYPDGAVWVHKTTGVITYNFCNLRRDLNHYGLCRQTDKHNKVIPDEYLTASKEQRLALLAGLLDTDGYLDKKHHRYVFTTADSLLKESFRSLIATFGWHCSVYTTSPKRSSSGIDGKREYWQLAFNPTEHIPCVLERKKLYEFSKQRTESIIAIMPGEPEPGKCITVEGGIYLTGRYLTPTHNSASVTESLPAYWLGKHPDKKWMVASYNTDFASNFGRKNRQKCQAFNKDIFGDDFRLEDSPCNNIEFYTPQGGGVYSAGILAGLTGHTADCFLIDDPIKTRQEAESSTTKEAIWGEYLSSVRTRIKPGGKLIVIQTRWAEDDLFGRIAQTEKNVTAINIPCECEDPLTDPLHRHLGDALCPEIGRGNAWLQSFKQVYTGKQGQRAWTSLYQGHPTQLEGDLIKRGWWHFYESPPDDIPYKVISVDAAFKDSDENDFVAIQVWGKKNGNYYLLDYLKEHLNFVQTVAAIRSKAHDYPDTWYILIEDKANGSAIINVLSSEFDNIVPVTPNGGKESRVNAVLPTIEAGKVWLPQYQAYSRDFVDSCAAFPNGEHDDDVDAMSQALNRMIFVDADLGEVETKRYTHWTEDMLQDYENANPGLQKELLDTWGYPRNYDI